MALIVLNDHKDVDQYGPYAIPSEVMPCYSYPAILVNQFEILINSSCLTSSSDCNYVPNEQEYVDQYDPYAQMSEIMLW